MYIKCKECGFKTQKEKFKSFGGKFCPHCGTRIEEALSEEKATAVKTLEILKKIMETLKEYADEPTKKHWEVKLFIVVVVVLVLQSAFSYARDVMFPERTTPEELAIEDPELESMLLQAYNEIGAGNYSIAENIYLNALELKGNTPRVLNSLGYLNDVQGKIKEAKFYYEETLLLDPFNSVANQNLGIMSKTNKEYDQALEYFDKALSADIANTTVLLNQAEIYMEQKKDYESATSILDYLISLDPQKKRAYLMLLEIYKTTGDREESSRVFEKAKLVFPNDPEFNQL